MSPSWVGSSPPVSCTGKRSGPSMRQSCGTPVTFQLKTSALPSGMSAPAPGARRSSMAWMWRDTSPAMGRGRNFSSNAGGTLSAP